MFPLEQAFFPVDEDIGSDSALLDNVVELLLAAGTRDLAEVIMMVIPEAWQNTSLMQKEKKDFYKYLSCALWAARRLNLLNSSTLYGIAIPIVDLADSRYIGCEMT